MSTLDQELAELREKENEKFLEAQEIGEEYKMKDFEILE